VIEQICGSKNLRKLDFSYTKFDDKCASIISNYIEKHNTIVMLKLEGCNLSNEALLKLMRSMKQLSSITTLHLGHFSCWNMRKSMFDFFSESSITELLFNNTPLTTIFLEKITPSFNNLRRLELSNTELTIEGLKSVSILFDQLYHLNISNNKFGEGWEKCFESNCELISLNIQNCSLKTGLGIIIKRTTIIQIYAGGNPWSQEELENIAESLRESQYLNYIGLDYQEQEHFQIEI